MTDEQGQLFFRIGADIVKSGALSTMTAADLKVYLVLSLHANWRTGKCWPSYATIRGLSGCSRSSIAGAVRHLVQAGAIVHRKIRTRSGLRNEYTIFRTLSPSPGGRSSRTDDPSAKQKRDDSGRYQSSRTDDPRSRTTDDPQSSRTDQNEIQLNEINRTRSKGVNPPAPIQGSVEPSAKAASARPLSPTQIELVKELVEEDGLRGAIAFLAKAGRLAPPCFSLMGEP